MRNAFKWFSPKERRVVLLTVDIVTFSVASSLHVALLPRRTGPMQGCLALPGTVVAEDESLEAAADRVVRQKLGVSGRAVQLRAFGAVDRVAGKRVVTVASACLVPEPPPSAVSCRVVSESGDLVRPDGEAVHLPWDHAAIVEEATRWLRGSLTHKPHVYSLLPERFTLARLRAVQEIVSGKRLNKDSFRRSVLARGELMGTGEREVAVGHRPAELYTVIKGGSRG